MYGNLGGTRRWQPRFTSANGANEAHNVREADLDGRGDLEIIDAGPGNQGSLTHVEVWLNQCHAKLVTGPAQDAQGAETSMGIPGEDETNTGWAFFQIRATPWPPLLRLYPWRPPRRLRPVPPASARLIGAGLTPVQLARAPVYQNRRSVYNRRTPASLCLTAPWRWQRLLAASDDRLR